MKNGKMLWRFVAMAFVVYSVAFAAGSAVAAHTVDLITRNGQPALVIRSDKPIRQKQLFTLNNPQRIVLDLDRMHGDAPIMPDVSSHPLISQVRFGQFGSDTSRIVIELRSVVDDYALTTSRLADGQYQAMLTLVTHGQSQASSPVEYFAPEQMRTFGDIDGKPLIAIDAGHGGKDPGAIGISSVQEKDITLSYAKALRNALLKTGKYDVILTRDDDSFIYLHERVRLARTKTADLFISLHADTADVAAARGVSVYTISEDASDREADILAQQENAADKIGGISFAEKNPEVADILIDLASRSTRIKSDKFAHLLIEELRERNVLLLTNPVRHAGFRVLKTADIPSVLMEIGFLSNPRDEILLQQTSHRKMVIASIVSALGEYFNQK